MDTWDRLAIDQPLFKRKEEATFVENPRKFLFIKSKLTNQSSPTCSNSLHSLTDLMAYVWVYTRPSLRTPSPTLTCRVGYSPAAVFAQCCPFLPHLEQLDSEWYSIQPESIKFPPRHGGMRVSHDMQMKLPDVNGRNCYRNAESYSVARKTTKWMIWMKQEQKRMKIS